jgi:hypothetical protein
MFDETRVPREVIVDMMRQDPIEASFRFFDLFLHKDTGIMKCKNWIVMGNYVYEIAMVDTEDPRLGNHIIKYPTQSKSTYHKIAVKVLSLCMNYIASSQSYDVFEVDRNDAGQTLLDRAREMWITRALPRPDGTIKSTASDIVTTKTYDESLSGLAAYIEANLPRRAHVHAKSTLDDGERIDVIPKTPNTIMVWVCRKCWHSCVYRSKIKSHLKTCTAQGEPKLCGVRCMYSFENSCEDSREDSDTETGTMHGTMSGFDIDVFGKGRDTFDNDATRSLKISRMGAEPYKKIFDRECVEDLIISVFSHFYGKSAEPTWQSCFKTDDHIHIYIKRHLRDTKGKSIACIPIIKTEPWPSESGRQLLMTHIRTYLFELIDFFGYDTEDSELDPKRQNGLSGLKTKIARRNYMWLRKRGPGEIQGVPWTNVVFDTVVFGHRPNLKSFTTRLYKEIPYLSDIQRL